MCLLDFQCSRSKLNTYVDCMCLYLFAADFVCVCVLCCICDSSNFATYVPVRGMLQWCYPSEGCFSNVQSFHKQYPPLLLAKECVQSIQKRTIRLYFLENSVLNHSKNNYPSLLVAKECVQSFQKQLSAFTFCKRWCSIIPKTTAIRFYLLQNFVFNNSQNKYPPLPVATNAAQSFQKQLSAFTFC